MNKRMILGAGFTLLLMTLGASAGTVQLDVSGNYNFPLAGGGGGATATVNGVSYQIFCVDFDNEINLNTDYSATETQLGTSANLSGTRFGGISGAGWTQFSTLGTADDAFLNTGGGGASALARYSMVAYLDTLYVQTNQNTNPTLTDNNEIQNAIWSLLDPAGETVPNTGYNGASYLEQAVTWYLAMDTAPNLTALNAFLADFDILSPTSMKCSNDLVNCGFQEQIIDPTPGPIPTPVPTPEPRGSMWMIAGVLALGTFLWRRNGSNVHSTN
jgi:hypothetical protein